MEHTTDPKTHFERPTTENQEFPVVRRIVYLALVAALGCIAGAAGYLIAQSQMPLPQYSVYPTGLTGDAQLSSQGSAVYDALNIVQERTVAIIQQRQRGTSDYEQLIDPSEYLGSGVIATSDGWIMTSIPASQLARVAVVVDREIIPAERVGTDQATGISFLKIDARNLNPVDISGSVSSGEMLISFGPKPGVTPRPSVARVLYDSYRVVRTKLDYVHSSDTISVFALIDPSTEPSVGQAYFTNDGRFAGFIQTVGTDLVIIQPATARLALEQALRQETSKDLGIFYIINYSDDARDTIEQGVTIFHPTRAAVRPSSLAARAGLLKGDTIVRIAGEVIDQKQGFDYLWKKHQQDQGGVDLVIIREGVEGPIRIDW